MILVPIATALAVGAYVVISKDAPPKRLNAAPRESLRLLHSVDHLLDPQKHPPDDLRSIIKLWPQ